MIRMMRYLKEHKAAVCIIVLFLILQAVCDIALPTFTSDIVDIGIAGNGITDAVRNSVDVSTLTKDELYDIQMHYLLTEGLKMLGVSLLMIFSMICATLVAARTGARIARDLRGKVFRNVVRFSEQEIDRFSTASLITRCTNDVQQIQMVLTMFLRMVLYAPVIGIAGIVMVARTEISMAWIIVLAVAAVVILVLVLMRIAVPKFRIMQSLIDRLNLVSREVLTGVSVIRAFNRQKEEESRFDGANQELYRTQLFANRVMTFMMPVMTLIMNGVSVLIVWVSANRIDAGEFEVGKMIAFITYAMLIVISFLMLTMMSIMLPRAGVAAERIDEIIETETAILDPEHPRDHELTDPQGEIVFDHVTFAYPGAETPVLQDISFTAPAHKTTAIIGGTGSGKSTIVRLIPRFYDVSEGSIRFDGLDIRDLTQHALRSRIGYVPQKGILFSGTVASNLKYADEAISDEVMEMAAETAQATEFILASEEGYDRPIAQNGANVSGGQKQRLAIARAIAARPAVYLFDDSFSALDSKTDAALRRALAGNSSRATRIIVAQRISTIMHADRIVVLDKGRIAGIGTHEELMQSCRTYQDIARSQLPEEDLPGMESAPAPVSPGTGDAEAAAEPADRPTDGIVAGVGDTGDDQPTADIVPGTGGDRPQAGTGDTVNGGSESNNTGTGDAEAAAEPADRPTDGIVAGVSTGDDQPQTGTGDAVNGGSESNTTGTGDAEAVSDAEHRRTNPDRETGKGGGWNE